ncbi:MAG: hypothetical protein LC689_03375, partial [Myxococcales bacterium]|nr:hypothetical protein [Myxococcales bacterium]
AQTPPELHGYAAGQVWSAQETPWAATQFPSEPQASSGWQPPQARTSQAPSTHPSPALQSKLC